MAEKIVIDGENTAMGRVAAYAAKQALQGKEVAILNSDKVIITGTKEFIIAHQLHRRTRHGSSLKGPVIIRNPERMVKRTIRGMLPWKKGHGAEAFKRILCYNGVPSEFEKSAKIKVGKEKGNKYMNVKEVAELM